MAWRPSDWVLEGELDNTILGWTTGWLKIEGIEKPLQLKLAGNCHPDLAGWKFKIVRTEPIPDWACLLYTSPSPRDRTRSRMPSSA